MTKTELADAPFDYALVDKDQASKLRYCANEIRKYKSHAAVSIMGIGEMLLIAQEQKVLGRTFVKWIETECGLSKSSAYRYMQAFNVFGKFPTVGKMEDGAVYALAQNATPEKARKEVLRLTEKGVQITQKQALKIIKRHKADSEPPASPQQTQAAPSAAKPPKPPKPPKGKPVQSAAQFCDQLTKQYVGPLARELLKLAQMTGGQDAAYKKANDHLDGVLQYVKEKRK